MGGGGGGMLDTKPEVGNERAKTYALFEEPTISVHVYNIL